MKSILQIIVLIIVAVIGAKVLNQPVPEVASQKPVTGNRPSATPFASPTPVDLTLLSPAGKLLTFKTAEQKNQFLAAQRKIDAARQEQENQRQAEQAAKEIQNAERARVEALWRQSKGADFKVVQITSQGVLAHLRPEPKRDEQTYYSAEVYFVAMIPPEALVDGGEFRALVYEDGTFTYKTVLGAQSKVKKLGVAGRVHLLKTPTSFSATAF